MSTSRTPISPGLFRVLFPMALASALLILPAFPFLSSPKKAYASSSLIYDGFVPYADAVRSAAMATAIP